MLLCDNNNDNTIKTERRILKKYALNEPKFKKKIERIFTREFFALEFHHHNFLVYLLYIYLYYYTQKRSSYFNDD